MPRLRELDRLNTDIGNKFQQRDVVRPNTAVLRVHEYSRHIDEAPTAIQTRRARINRDTGRLGSAIDTMSRR